MPNFIINARTPAVKITCIRNTAMLNRPNAANEDFALVFSNLCASPMTIDIPIMLKGIVANPTGEKPNVAIIQLPAGSTSTQASSTRP